MSNSSSIAAAGFSLFQLTTTVIVVSYIIISVATVLNFIEIYLIARKWKQVTNFELVLLNLAVADVLNCIIYATISGVSHYVFINKLANRAEHVFWVLVVNVFSMTASTSFVIVIGVERFFAVKVPLKHRLWHTGKRKLLKCTSIVWGFDILVTAAILSINFYINGKNHLLVLGDISYYLAGYLTIGLILVSSLYIWLGHLILMRSMKLFEFDKKDFSINPKAIKHAMKKDRATILVCTLVVISLFTCNLPLIIDLYMKRITHTTSLLIKLNAIANPMIYFFKGYLEKYYGKMRLASFHQRSSNQESESSRHKKKDAECNEMKSVSTGSVKVQESQGSMVKSHEQYLSDLELNSEGHK